ncbi:COG3014 family protein [Marinobacterium aestuariivivens]|uniref:COG3014 family protein n=1 Tax=Marinobacterium aestuariivivens TaxID=1698799 RepID=A0ABW2A398_9GAMM
MRSRNPFIKGLAVFSSVLFISGCQTLSNRQNLATFDEEFAIGQYRVAAENALAAGSIQTDGTSNDLLWSLHAGTALTASGDYALSASVFDGAEALMKEEDTEHIGRKAVEKVTATIINNNLNRYTPTVYDGVMVNTYKALNFIFLEDLQNARIEFNRAADRQRRAEEHFKGRIEKQKQTLSDQKNKAKDNKPAAATIQYDKSREESENTIYAAFPELEEWKTYPDFVNPYTDYLHGLYFTLSSQDSDDYGKARHSLRRVAGMTPNNSAVATDLKVAENLRRGVWSKHRLNPAVWVIFENGEAPLVEELQIPIPLFLVNDKVEYSQIALPKLSLRQQAYPHLEIYSGKKQLGKTELLASLDRVIQTEFKKEFPLKVTEAVASTLAKAFIQYKARQEFGLTGSLVAGIYQASTTKADTRSWSSLPKEVQVARLRKPGDGKLLIKAPGLSEPMQVELPDSQFSIVYVKASAPGAKPIYMIKGFDA